MGSYLEEVDGKDFTDLVDNQDFQRDLVKFFSGKRYGMSPDEMKELGAQGLAEKFVEHMRWQDTNELTALKDYNYVQQEDLRNGELQSFGNLMMAYDRADGGGTGVLSGAVDYLSAFASSPSTLATAATAGWGVGSKLAAKASAKAAQMAIRQEVSNLVKQGVAKSVIKDKIAGTVAKNAVKGAATSFVAEGLMGAGQAKLQGETREEATGIEYTNSDLLRDGLIAGTIGGALGSATRALTAKRQRALVDNIFQRDAGRTARLAASDKAAKKVLSSADAVKASSAADKVVTSVLNLDARLTKTKLDPLDPKLVERGDLLKKQILTGTTAEGVVGGLSIETMRGITAAAVELTDGIKLKPNERITSGISRALDAGEIDGNFLEKLRTDFGLTEREFSYIYLSELSEAGKTLATASTVARKNGRKAAVKGAKETVKNVTHELSNLAKRGVLKPVDVEVASEIAGAYKSKGSGTLKALRTADSVRLAFMTSQFGTTMANTITSTGNLLVDMSDHFWKNVAYATFGRNVEGKIQRGWVGGSLSTIKGLTWNKEQSDIFKEIFLEEAPEEYSKLFYEAARAEMAIGGESTFAAAGRFVNVLNSSVDSVFKQGVLYSSVDRSLRELNNPAIGRNMGEFLKNNKSLDNLPKEFLSKAVDDARRFTFQRSYKGDPSMFGQTAQFMIDAHHKAPFVISSGLGIPFPRYIANHLEHINDYTPIGLITGGLNRYDSIMFGDVNKTAQDRFARQMTGASLFLLGAYTAANNEGTIDYDKIETETGIFDISRIAGPWLMNFYLGDLYYRWKNGLPTGDLMDIMGEVAKIGYGQETIELKAPIIAEVIKSAESGEMTIELGRSLGDIAATFSYPITPTRDFLAEVDTSKLPVPYTREVFGGSLNEPETYGEGNYLDEMLRRATRFFPEVDFLQYTQSYNGKESIPVYSPFNSSPIGSFDPLSKQLGMTVTPKPNSLQKEMARLNISEYELYGKKTVPNPAVDVVVQKVLAQNLPQRFAAWKDQMPLGGKFAEMTYAEASRSGNYTSGEMEQVLRDFVKSEISGAVSKTEDMYDQFLSNNPRAAAGYIRNMYVIQERQAMKDTGNKHVYDMAVLVNTNRKFKTAEEYLGDSTEVEVELTRRQEIMTWSKNMSDGFEPFPVSTYKQ